MRLGLDIEQGHVDSSDPRNLRSHCRSVAVESRRAHFTRSPSGITARCFINLLPIRAPASPAVASDGFHIFFAFCCFLPNDQAVTPDQSDGRAVCVRRDGRRLSARAEPSFPQCDYKRVPLDFICRCCEFHCLHIFFSLFFLVFLYHAHSFAHVRLCVNTKFAIY